VGHEGLEMGECNQMKAADWLFVTGASPNPWGNISRVMMVD